jgi:hypothetical protein
MKNTVLLAALTAALLVSAACTSTAPANANSTTTTTNTTTTNVNRATTPPASNTTNTSTTNTSTSNTSSTSNTNATAEGKQDFTLVNKTGVVINKLFISPHDSNDWQEDILGQDTLGDGESLDIKFHRSEKAANWDMRIEDTKGNAIEWENLNLLEISKITIHYENGKATAETE